MSILYFTFVPFQLGMSADQLTIGIAIHITSSLLLVGLLQLNRSRKIGDMLWRYAEDCRSIEVPTGRTTTVGILCGLRSWSVKLPLYIYLLWEYGCMTYFATYLRSDGSALLTH